MYGGAGTYAPVCRTPKPFAVSLPIGCDVGIGSSPPSAFFALKKIDFT